VGEPAPKFCRRGQPHPLRSLTLLRTAVGVPAQVLSEEAKVTLQAFYLQLRQQVAAGSSSPITVRVVGGVCA